MVNADIGQVLVITVRAIPMTQQLEQMLVARTAPSDLYVDS